MTDTEDVVRALGFLTLGSRLKRLGERLQAQTQALLEEARIALPASHLPLMAALARHGALSVGGLARALGTSQPGVTRQVSALQALGLVGSDADAADQRQRRIALTPAGRRLVARAQRQTWPRVEAAVVDACGADGAALLAHLAQLEDALAAAPLQERAAARRTRGTAHAPA